MTTSTSNDKITVQRYIFIGGIMLFIIKVVAFYITNSVGILSDALESTVNIISGFITLKSLQFAAKPRDEDHPYGHGKVELITASVEGILIGVAGIMIIIESIKRLGNPPEILKMDVGIFLMFSTAIINYLMGRYSIRQGIKNSSVALVTGGKHLISDTYTTIALIAGLVIFFITGLQWMDSALAIAFGLFILYTGFTVLKVTINGLMDEADTHTISVLVKTLSTHKSDQWINIHKLTYLKFGDVSHVDFHLTLPWYYDMNQSAKEILILKSIIRNQLPEGEVDISIQSEPCFPSMCHHCTMSCDHRIFVFTKERVWTTEQITGKNNFTV